MPRVDPQRAAVRRKLLDVEQLEPGLRERALDGDEREVREVLVVDRVELGLLDQPQQVRELHRHDAARPQSARSPATKSRSGPARARARCCRSARSASRPARAAAGQLERRRTRRASGSRPPRRAAATFAAGSIPSTGTPRSSKYRKEVAVVARDLDDLARRVEAEALDHLVDVVACVLDPAVGVRREVRVVAEDLLGRRRRRQAGRGSTDRRRRRAADRRARDRRAAPRSGTRSRAARAEVDERVRQRCAARPALGAARPSPGRPQRPACSRRRDCESTPADRSRARARAGPGARRAS